VCRLRMCLAAFRSCVGVKGVDGMPGTKGVDVVLANPRCKPDKNFIGADERPGGRTGREGGPVVPGTVYHISPQQA
jgi:hypothetical protein